jgi:hypothetical protein
MKSAAEKISVILSSKENPENEKKFLDAVDLFKIENLFGEDSLSLPYINIEDRSFSLKEFLRYFRIENFFSDTTDFKTILSLLNNKTKKFIEEEMLAEEGYKRGLQYSNEVGESYNMWADNYLSQLARAGIVNTGITEEDLVNEYENYSKRKNIKVNIIEILTDSLELVEDILNRINSGEDMHSLANKYSKREWTRKTNGEFGLFYTSMHGEIGRIAGTMEVGEIYGPVKVPEGYSIFQLIDRREENIEKLPPFEEIKAELMNEVSARNSRTDLNDYTVNLALKYGVTIDFDLLRTIPHTGINMVGFRYLGFGSRITAVPLIPPNADWVIPWLNKKNLIQ